MIRDEVEELLHEEELEPEQLREEPRRFGLDLDDALGDEDAAIEDTDEDAEDLERA